MPWVLWAKLVKRDIILEILFFGTIIILTTTLLDVVGAQYSFWDYPIAFLPWFDILSGDTVIHSYITSSLE